MALDAPKRTARGRGSESGSIVILTALSMVVLLGIMAFAVDASFLYTERNRMAAAADAAAKSAAIEYRRAGASNLQAFANREVLTHGFDPADPSVAVLVNRPPSSGSFTSNPNYVEVRVSRQTTTFFARAINAVWNTVTPLARAVAGTSSGPNCMVTLNQSGNPSLDIGGTVSMSMPNCGIAANGNMHVGNGVGSVSAASVGVQGTCTGCPSNTTTGIPAATDPLSTLPEPTNPYGAPTAYSLANNQPPATLSQGWYSSITIGNNDDITLNPGLYYVTGPVLIGNSANIHGSGVTIFLAGTHAAGPCTAGVVGSGCLDLANSATVNLSAPTAGPYEGILFFQSRSNALDVTFANSSTYTLSGAMYFPAASVTLGNAGGSNDCTLFVAQNISLAGNGGGSMSFSNTCSAYGGSPLLTVSLAE